MLDFIQGSVATEANKPLRTTMGHKFLPIIGFWTATVVMLTGCGVRSGDMDIAVEPPEIFTISTRDGSVQKCVFEQRELPFKAIIGTTKLALTDVQSIIPHTSKMKVLFRNGDTLTGKLLQDNLVIHWSHGRSVLPIDRIASILAVGETTTDGFGREQIPQSQQDGLNEWLHVGVSMRDGSTIMGRIAPLDVDVVAAIGRYSIGLERVSSIVFQDDREHARLLLPNGDRMSGVVTIKDLKVVSDFGEFGPKLDAIERIVIHNGKGLPPQLKDALILKLSFNENGKPEDESPKKHEGKWHGAVQFITDRNGVTNGACRLNGSSTYLDISAIRASLPRDKHTISMWVRADKAAMNGGAIFSNWHRELLFFRKGNLVGHISLSPRLNDPKGTGTHVMETPITDLADRWCHIVLTFDAGDHASLYIDGKLLKTEESPRDEGAAWYRKNFEIGRIKDFTPAREHFSGDVDDVYIFDRALSEEEVLQFYSSF